MRTFPQIKATIKDLRREILGSALAKMKVTTQIEATPMSAFIWGFYSNGNPNLDKAVKLISGNLSDPVVRGNWFGDCNLRPSEENRTTVPCTVNRLHETLHPNLS